MPDPKRDESRLPSPLVVMFWLNEQNQMRPIACATEEKREDSVKRAAQCFNYSTHDYVPYSDLEAAQRKIAELEKAANDVVSFRDSCVMCEHTETRKRELEMYRSIDRLESLLPKEPHA